MAKIDARKLTAAGRHVLRQLVVRLRKPTALTVLTVKTPAAIAGRPDRARHPDLLVDALDRCGQKLTPRVTARWHQLRLLLRRFARLCFG